MGKFELKVQSEDTSFEKNRNYKSEKQNAKHHLELLLRSIAILEADSFYKADTDADDIDKMTKLKTKVQNMIDFL
jgi:hypothetical protein